MATAVGIRAKPGLALAAGADPVVADGFSAVCSHGRLHYKHLSRAAGVSGTIQPLGVGQSMDTQTKREIWIVAVSTVILEAPVVALTVLAIVAC